jgi:hypothetical protein
MFRWNEKESTFENIQDGRRLDVQGGRDREGNNVQIWKKNNSAAQKWKLVYTDKADKIKTEGVAEDYGMKINKPFYIQTVMGLRRVVTAHGAHHVRINRPDANRQRTSQHWVYDNVSKTIKSVQWPNRALHLAGSNVVISPVTSRWNQIW